ncbi:SRPBCC domain-containing protein [Patescibacteria group bacterium]|nr:SRPBCC domain-containing protein [Patescibacteria group bacterium]
MKTNYTVLPESHQLTAERSFAAPKTEVWRHFTTAELLELWWAPLPFKAVTKSFNFRTGGHWHYIMQGPEGEAHYCVNMYKTINPENSFTATDAFAHEDWSINTDVPVSEWEITFTQNGDTTTMKMVLTCSDRAALDTLIEMGMKEGYNQALDQLEALLLN